MKRSNQEKLDLIGKIQFSMRTQGLTEACSLHGVVSQQYKAWCAEFNKPYKPGFEQVTVFRAAEKAPASGCEQEDPVALAQRLFSLATSCVIVLELPNGKTFHVETKGNRDQIKFLQCIADLQIDRSVPSSPAPSQIERQAAHMHDNVIPMPPPIREGEG